MCGRVGRPEKFDLVERAMEIQTLTEEWRREAQAQLERERLLVVQLAAVEEDERDVRLLAAAMRQVGKRMAGRSEWLLASRAVVGVPS